MRMSWKKKCNDLEALDARNLTSNLFFLNRYCGVDGTNENVTKNKTVIPVKNIEEIM